MLQGSFWIAGSTQSGKTTRLVSQFRQWVEAGLGQLSSRSQSAQGWHRDRRIAPAILVFAANDDNRRNLSERLTSAIQGRYPVRVKTPLGFFQDEVILFWPLLVEQLPIKAQFPLRLRPETEQELATQQWREAIEQGRLQFSGVSEYKIVRRLLDLLLLAALSGTPVEDIPSILQEGLPEDEGTPELWEYVGQLLLDWKQWCLDRGLLTYGMIAELYWRHLLPNPTYQQHLQQRYQAVLADDVDDYPAIARDLFECLLNHNAVGAFTYNPDGKVRLGLNADPHYLEELASRCEVETLATPMGTLAETLSDTVVELINDPMLLGSLPESLVSLQTTSRAALLRQAAQIIIDGVKSGQVAPGDIAIIAPGLDEIARYVLTDILTKQGIPVEPLNEQRPLISVPMIRALLTLLALVYPGLGRWVDRDAVAQMLVVLSQRGGDWETETEDKATVSPFPLPQIDPVRAGLLADYCYSPNPEYPQLLPVETFSRWDRLGHRATKAYTEIVQWLEEQRSQQQQRLIPSVLAVLDRAIQKFLWNGSHLPYDQLAALRELMETAQHYWEVDGRLRQESKVGQLQESPSPPSVLKADLPAQATIAHFIQLLRRGTVTANPYPVRRFAPAQQQSVTLATIFQYRASRRVHRWHFWLDAGSPLWLSGGAATLFAAPLFLNEWSGRIVTQEDKINADQQRLQRILRDLLGRAGERVYLCHSDLAVSGIEQTGPLLTVVNASVPLAARY